MTLRLNGSTSGYVEIDAPAVAANNTLTLPSGGELVAATSGNINVTSINSLNYPTAGALSNRNKIINGDMRIDQRNAGASVNSGGFLYTVDRWQTYEASSGQFAIQQSTDAPAGFTHSLRFTVTTTQSSLNANDQYIYQQYIEGYNAADLAFGTVNAKAITVSFWVKGSVTGTYPVAILNGSSNRSYVTTFAVNAANTWEFKTATIPGDTAGTWFTDNQTGLMLRFCLGGGSDFNATANTWNASYRLNTSNTVNLLATNGATFYITGVQLEAGTVATPFERRSYGQELALCQRYFWKTYDLETAVATSTTIGTLIFTRWNDLGNFSYNSVQYPVQMRAAPTIVGYGPTGTVGVWRDNGGVDRAFTTPAIGTSSFHATSFGSGVTTTGQIYGHVTVSAEL